METDLNLNEKTCFDNLCKNTNKAKVLKSSSLLEHIEQEINNLPIDEREILLNELYEHVSLDTNEVIIVSKETAKKVPLKKKLIFGWRKSPELLTMLMYEIQDKIHLFVDRSYVAVFVRMATCDDLSQESVKIPLASMTIVFKYFIDQLKPHCKSFTPTTIERSGLFISNLGNPVKANCLYNSSTDNLHKKILIDSIFKKML